MTRKELKKKTTLDEKGKKKRKCLYIALNKVTSVFVSYKRINDNTQSNLNMMIRYMSKLIFRSKQSKHIFEFIYHRAGSE